MKPDGHTSTLAESFKVALAGIVEASGARNFRIELCFAVAAIVLGICFRISIAEWVAIVICIGLVLGAECFNTAIEDTVDIACPQEHPQAKRAKDSAAGAVLLCAIASFIVGVVIFAPRILGALGL